MGTKLKRIFIFSGVILLALMAFGGALARADESGSKDHPLLSRFPGSDIMVYDAKEFNEYVLPLGKMLKGKLVKSQKLEGKVTQLNYSVPADRSVLEIFRNYESALKAAGFVTLLAGNKTELGAGWLGEFIKATARPSRYGGVTFNTRIEDDFRYIAAKLTRAEGDVYVALCVGSSWYQKFPSLQLDIIEVKPMETGLVKVNAAAMAKDIDITGHSSIYGIYFDTGKSEVAPKSEEALAEIAKLLGLDPKLNLYVVGHTDNVGTLASNMDLSKLRAEAVVKVLVAKYGIDADRLTAAGVGPLSPVLANKIEEGRAKNRRVELVKQ